MKSILLTGATGNIGKELLHYLHKKDNTKIVAALRNINKDKEQLSAYEKLSYVKLDFEDSSTFDKALQDIDQVFLLRPPHITDIENYFRPFLEQVVTHGIKELIFLSVQGAEKSTVIPHNKLEKLIQEFDINYIFVRPSYFMQNLSTTLYKDIKEQGKIFLPAKNAKFVWIDTKNIGEATALLFQQFDKYKNKAIEITGYEVKDFNEVVALMNSVLDKKIEYKAINPVSFYFMKRKQGVVGDFVIVMLILHFLPRFQKTPEISSFYEEISGKKPSTLLEFIKREKTLFEA